MEFSDTFYPASLELNVTCVSQWRKRKVASMLTNRVIFHLKCNQISHQSLVCADFTQLLPPPPPGLIVPHILLRPAGQRGILHPCGLGILVPHAWMEASRF